MNCENCLHYGVCKTHYSLGMLALIDGNCSNYDDRTEWLHLPCKVGDIVYKISFVHKNITPLTVDGFLCNLSSWKVHCTHLIPSWVGNQKEHIYIAFSSFGKRVFLTQEEAEKALKERDNNA